MKHIVCFHLFNDYSGSPKVLKMVLEGLLKEGYQVDLVTSKGGVLDELTGHGNLHIHSYRYHFSSNPVLTMCRYAMVQVYTFLVALKLALRKDVVFYINTLLPVGPALAGRLTGKHVVYHYHENAFVKGIFYKSLAWCMQRLSSGIVCVSAYQASFLPQKGKVTVVPNALPKELADMLQPDAQAAFKRKTILMLSSLKAYKGTREFIELSERLPQYRFILVINDLQEHIDAYMKDDHIRLSERSNLTVYPRQSNVAAFYMQASVVLNLSNKDLVIETFGLTALEAMRAGLPVIVPTVGGIAEMVDDGENGYKIDVQNLDLIERRIREMLSHEEEYTMMADNALQKAKLYEAEEMLEKIKCVLEGKI